LLFGHPERSYYANEIVRHAGTGTVQRELERLAAAGLLTIAWIGNQKHYQANRRSLVFREIAGLVRKTINVGAATAAYRQEAAAPVPALRSPVAPYRAGGSQALRIPRAKLAALCRKYGIQKLSLFGSAACNELTPESDIDLMVEFEPEKAPSLWSGQEMESELSALFGNRRVNLAPPGILRNPYRRKSILPDLRVL
jgi:predicted nucleotidyltransferase